MSVRIASQAHEAAYQDLVALISRHAEKVDALEMLAIAANAVGKMIAYQDQRTTTPDQAMEIVIRNIERGNKQALDALMKSRGSA